VGLVLDPGSDRDVPLGLSNLAYWPYLRHLYIRSRHDRILGTIFRNERKLCILRGGGARAPTKNIGGSAPPHKFSPLEKKCITLIVAKETSSKISPIFGLLKYRCFHRANFRTRET